MVTLKLNFCRGNTVEEYCLPFIGFSTYGLLKWFKDKQKEHNWKWAFFYGITFGACLFTRATNIAPITGYILIICIFLLVNRSYLNLLKNALAFISGTALVLIPFIIYFAAHGALYDLIYATFIHNIKYFNGAEPWLITYGTGILGQFFETYFAYYCILFLIIIKIYQKDYWLAAAFGVIAIVETYVFMGGFIVTHYPLVCIFQIGILMLEVVQLIKDNTKASKSLGIVILLFLCVHIGYNCIYKDILEISDYRENYSEITERPYERLVKEIPTDELDDFVVFGRDGIAEAYLVTDTLPCNRFGFIQDWYASFSEKIEADIRKEYAENGPTWILSDQGTIIIDDILEKDYYVYDLEDVYVLWKKYEK